MIKYYAEIGLNHLGDEEECYKMIKSAILAGVDGITLQVWPKNYYDNSKSFRRELSINFYKKISSYLKKKKITFGIALSEEEVVHRFKNINVDFWKVLSFGFHNKNLISLLLRKKKKIFLSTGVASIKDIKKVSVKNRKLEFIHTTLSSKINDANLNAINVMKSILKNKKISFSLHSTDDCVVATSIALGANPIFFYVKNDNKKFYPDDAHAIRLSKLREKIDFWKKIEISLGTGIKKNLKIPKWVYV